MQFINYSTDDEQMTIGLAALWS